MAIHEAFILAGGEGTRLRPLTLEMPKPLVPVQGHSILTWQVRWLARYGIDRITVIIPPKWEPAFIEWRDRLEGMRAREAWPRIRLWKEPEPMGTLGALVHYFSAEMGDEPVLVTNGDELKAFDIEVLEKFHASESKNDEAYAVTVALVEVPNPSDYGVAEMRRSRIKVFHEKPESPPSNLISSGLYLVNPFILKRFKPSSYFLMFEKDLFPELATRGSLGGCQLRGAWYDCGTMERWERAIREWSEPV